MVSGLGFKYPKMFYNVVYLSIVKEYRDKTWIVDENSWVKMNVRIPNPSIVLKMVRIF